MGKQVIDSLGTTHYVNSTFRDSVTHIFRNVQIKEKESLTMSRANVFRKKKNLTTELKTTHGNQHFLRSASHSNLNRIHRASIAD